VHYKQHLYTLCYRKGNIISDIITIMYIVDMLVFPLDLECSWMLASLASSTLLVAKLSLVVEVTGTGSLPHTFSTIQKLYMTCS